MGKRAGYRMAIVLLSVAAGCTKVSATPYLNNSGFETCDFSSWTTTGKGWSIDKRRRSEGNYSALCVVSQGDAPELRACMQQISGVSADQIVEVALDVSAVNVVQTPNSKACLAILCVDERGNVLKEYRSRVVIPKSEFQEIKIDDAVVFSSTAQVFAMLVVEVYQTAENDDWWRFDNIRVQLHSTASFE